MTDMITAEEAGKLNKRRQVSPEMLRILLRYEPDTGLLFWRHRPVDLFPSAAQAGRWNTLFAEKEAFATINRKGYRSGAVFGVNHVAHRVIWAIMTGAWPTETVDHRNTDKADNRWANLRLATHAQNQWNKRTQRPASGVKGVSWNAQDRKWEAQIQVHHKKIHLGKFSAKDAAAAAYAAASARYHGEFGRTQ